MAVRRIGLVSTNLAARIVPGITIEMPTDARAAT